MPHIHTEPGHHDLTVSAFIIRTDTPEPTVMLHEHRRIGRLLQFGGHAELNETPWQGLLRELREESGYAPDQLGVFQPPIRFTDQLPGNLVHPLPFYFNTHQYSPEEHHFHSDLAYAMTAAGPPRYAIAERESSAIHLLTPADLRALPPDQIYEVTRVAALFVLETLAHTWPPVPTSEWPA